MAGAVTEGWRTINNQRYHFDSDGTMQYGWLNDEDNLYYLGDENDGAAKTGWVAIGEREDGDMTGISTLKYFGDSNSGQMER